MAYRNTPSETTFRYTMTSDPSMTSFSVEQHCKHGHVYMETPPWVGYAAVRLAYSTASVVRVAVRLNMASDGAPISSRLFSPRLRQSLPHEIPRALCLKSLSNDCVTGGYRGSNRGYQCKGKDNASRGGHYHSYHRRHNSTLSDNGAGTTRVINVGTALIQSPPAPPNVPGPAPVVLAVTRSIMNGDGVSLPAIVVTNDPPE